MVYDRAAVAAPSEKEMSDNRHCEDRCILEYVT